MDSPGGYLRERRWIENWERNSSRWETVGEKGEKGERGRKTWSPIFNTGDIIEMRLQKLIHEATPCMPHFLHATK